MKNRLTIIVALMLTLVIVVGLIVVQSRNAELGGAGNIAEIPTLLVIDEATPIPATPTIVPPTRADLPSTWTPTPTQIPPTQTSQPSTETPLPVPTQFDSSLLSANELYELGMKAYWFFENEKALNLFTEVIALDPEFVEAYAYRGEVYRVLVKYELAHADFEKAQSLEPSNPIVLAHLARFYSHLGDDEKALETVNRAIEIDPEIAVLYYQRARIYKNMYDYVSSRTSYEIAIQLDDVFPGILSNYATILVQTGDVNEGINLLNNLIIEYPDFIQPHLTLGYAYTTQGKYQEAMDTYANVEIISPDNVTGIIQRASLMWQSTGDFQSAFNEFERAEGINPNDGAIYVNWGVAYLNSGSPQLAVEMWNKAIDLDPTTATAHYNLGATVQNTDMVLAEQSYLRAIELNPRYHEALLNLGNLYRDQSRFTEAYEKYTSAINVFPQFWVAYWNRGITQSMVGGYELAIEDYNKALTIYPYHAPLYYSIGAAYLSLEDYDFALTAFQSAIDIDPIYPYAYYGLGLTYDLLGDADKAQENYQKAEDLGYSG